MTSSPRYRSHAEQQKVLGCAATLDPAKHPRRYARLKSDERLARERGAPFTETNAVKTAWVNIERAVVADKARKLCHMPIGEVAKELGVSRDQMNRIKKEFGLNFPRAKIKTDAPQVIQAMAPQCKTLEELTSLSGYSRRHVWNILKALNIKLGGACAEEAQDPAGA